jgi:hypothetical protein
MQLLVRAVKKPPSALAISAKESQQTSVNVAKLRWSAHIRDTVIAAGTTAADTNET